MAAADITSLVNSLTPEEQESVRQFIEFLKQKDSSPSAAFLAAADDFIAKHPELLCRLAQ